jgi:hypothetical protein
MTVITSSYERIVQIFTDLFSVSIFSLALLSLFAHSPPVKAWCKFLPTFSPFQFSVGLLSLFAYPPIRRGKASTR